MPDETLKIGCAECGGELRWGVTTHRSDCSTVAWVEESRKEWIAKQSLPGGLLLSPGEREAQRAQEHAEELSRRVEDLERRVAELEGRSDGLS